MDVSIILYDLKRQTEQIANAEPMTRGSISLQTWTQFSLHHEAFNTETMLILKLWAQIKEASLLRVLWIV